MSETLEELREEQAARPETDGHPGWRVTLYTMWVAQLCAMIGFAFVMPFIPFYVRQLGVPEARVPVWAGLLTSGTGLTMSIVAPLWGHVADRYGRKLMVQRAMFGGAVILSAMAYVRDVKQLLGLRIMQGAVTGTVSASVALVSSVTPLARMGFALGLMQTAVFAGNSIGPYLGGIAAEQFGYRTPFLVTGGLLILGGLLVLFGAKERFTRPQTEDQEEHSFWKVLASLKRIATAPGVLVLLIVYTMMNFSASFVGPIFPLFVEKVAGRPGQAAYETGLLLMVAGFSGALASVMAGRLSDRYGHKLVLVCCAVFAGIVCFPHLVVRDMNHLLVLRALAGLGAGGMSPAMNAMIATTVPRQSLGKAYGLTTTAGAFGWALGPLLGGVAAAQLGLRAPFAIMGCLLLLLAWVAQRAVGTTGNRESRMGNREGGTG
jgi:DHA1 family multidrug resistance protein-like MFS transporter